MSWLLSPLFRVLMAGAIGVVAADAAPQPKIKALIVDGFSNHDWRKTTAFIEATLTETGLFEVDVSTAPSEPAGERRRNWRPRFSDYAVVIQNCNNINRKELRWPRTVERDLEDYVRAGGGLLIYHSANNAFDHWPEYDRMIGLGWRDKNHGPAIQLDAGGRIRRIPPGQGESTSHGPRQDTLVIRLTDHPINRGMPDRWMTPDIEVYTFARGPAEKLTVLSYGLHHATNTYWPLEWVVAYGKGRVYNSSFGHIWKSDEGIPERVRCVGFQTTLIRAAEWLATGKTTLPIPKDFPTEKRIRIRP